ncbi:DUF3159 domain-containing protein [Georgenia sp. Z1344]|uniref:DUF3159 domain-containing protein n=1 Tax=Georgenia sp. Z1344 TaxID=3416706 RepID=UPI003CF761A5
MSAPDDRGPAHHDEPATRPAVEPDTALEPDEVIDPGTDGRSDDPGGPGANPLGGAAGAAGRRSGLGQVVAEDFSLAESIGGVRGVVEAVAPGAVFVTAFVITRELTIPLVASLAVAVLLCAVRLVQRTPLTQALSGLLGVGIGVVWAWRSGQAEDFFAWGLYVNGAYALGLLIAILVRWAPIGVLVELLKGRGMQWRTDPELAPLRRRYVAASWLWVGVFAARLAVQVPLYLSGEVAALGVARLVMGIPLFALAAWLTWALVRERPAATAG